MSHPVAGALFGAAVAAVAGSAPAGDIAARIESCVSSSSVEFGAVDQRVLLDADDQVRVQAEMERRYPVLMQHGFPVSRIVLWQKPGGEALFITLLEHPNKPNQSCFTATFAAARFAGIAQLKRKYLRTELSI
jgi:hypothetical protein